MPTSFRYAVGKEDSVLTTYGQTNNLSAALKMAALLSSHNPESIWEICEQGKPGVYRFRAGSELKG